MKHRQLHQANRLSWNAATRAHNSHKGDQARFLREGGSTLFPEELDLLGDLAGKSLLHLQCNSGQDTLSLARHGAAVTGVDLSDEAIAFARHLAEESGIPGSFVHQDVYDYLEQAEERFDLVFCSYGAVCWLSDLMVWARGIARALVPGGRLVVVDFHPVWMIFDEEWKPRYPYSTGGEPLAFDDGITDYVAFSPEGLVPWGYEEGVVDFANPHPNYEFPWGLGDLVSAVAGAGLRIEILKEYPYSNGARIFPGMRQLQGRRFAPPVGLPWLPLMYGLSAQQC